MTTNFVSSRIGRLLLCIAIAAAYFLFLESNVATTIQRSDGAEFALLAARGGLAHPSGYSNFLYLTELFLTVVGGNPYRTLSLFSALCTALAVGLLTFFCLVQRIPFVMSVIVPLTWGLSLPALLTATDAEVFALNHLLALILILSSFSIARAPTLLKLACFGIIFGVALGHHLLLLLLCPCLLLVVWSFAVAKRETVLPRFVQSCAILAIFASIGFLSVLTVIPRFNSNPELSFTNVDSWTSVIICVFRLGYGFWSAGATDSLLQQHALPIFFSEISLGTPILLLGILSIGVAILRRERISVTIAGLVLLQLVFLFLLRVESDFSEIDWLHRFFSLPLLMLALGTGITFRPMSGRFGTATLLLGLLLVVATALRLPTTIRDGARGNHTEAERYVRDELNALPPKAILITTTDLLGFGARYLQTLEDTRTDVLVINRGRVGSTHYRRLLGEWLLKRYAYNEALPEGDLQPWLCRFGDPVVIEGESTETCPK